METALDVLSRAATMVQDNANEARLTSKELPSAKWRRERRLRAGLYHQQTAANAAASSSTATPPGTPPPPPPHPLALTHQHHGNSSSTSSSPSINESMLMAAAAMNRSTTPPSSNSSLHMGGGHLHHLQHPPLHHQAPSPHSMESPIDMSVTSTTMKHQRASPPPPYREPLPGSSFASSLARPSVITQAPPKRDGRDTAAMISNRENDNNSTESISMCETVIDEHFRRSLGADYIALFGKKSPAPTNMTTPSPQPPPLLAGAAGTPTPPPPIAMSLAPAHIQHHQAPPQQQPPAPAYHAPLAAHTHSLISPKPTAALLSPAAVMSQVKMEPISPRHQPNHGEKSLTPPLMSVALPPPQQQPLALQRCSSPQLRINNSPPQALVPPPQQRLPAKPASPPAPLNKVPVAELHSTTHSPTPSPRHSPAIGVLGNHSTVSSSSVVTVVASGPTTPTSVPAVMRIKTEPGLSATNTPPASPTSSSNASLSANSDVMASVDDHFAKALGETWKKLQENKDIRK